MTILCAAVMAVLFSVSLFTPASAHDGPAREHAEWSSAGSWSEFGNGHGEIAVSRNGDIYVSVIDEAAGMHVYDREGSLIRTIDGYPKDVHGFVILGEDGQEVIYATQRFGDAIIYKTDLAGNVLLEVSKSVLPEEQYWENRRGQRVIAATSITVAPDGAIYVVTGYGGDRIHRFDPQGNYVESWDGRSEEFGLNQAHKMYLDTRYEEPRLLVTDRQNARLVHLSLDGAFLGVFAEGLRRPSALAFRGDTVAVAEIAGRISILDKNGQVSAVVSENTQPEQINTNQTPPEAWREGLVTSPHGIAFDHDGSVLVTEWNRWGRVLRFTPEPR